VRCTAIFGVLHSFSFPSSVRHFWAAIRPHYPCLATAHGTRSIHMPKCLKAPSRADFCQVSRLTPSAGRATLSLGAARRRGSRDTTGGGSRPCRSTCPS
jgi:hypothetical protein